jgi:NitT/TauT family transport system substrate-binding protein
MTHTQSFRRLQIAAAGLALGSFTLAGCSSDSSSGDDAAAAGGCNGEEVSVGMTSSASDAPFYIADEKGYFQDNGLTVEFVPFDSAAKMIAPLGGGQLDVGAGAPSAGFYNAVARDVNLRVVADKGSMPEHYGYMPLLVRKDLVDTGKVQDIGDLAGLKIAEPAEATATSSTLATMLDSAGLGYDDVNHEFIGFGEHSAAFSNEAIDAALTTEPSATVAVEQGVAVRLATPPDFYENQQLAVVLYSETFAQDRPEVAQCFMSAYLQGARDYDKAFVEGELTGKAGDEVASIVSAATGLEEDLYRKIVPNFVDPNGAVNLDSMKKDYAFFEEQGFLESSVEIEDIVDPSFAEAAVEELGAFEGNG